MRALAVDPATPTTLYVAIANAGVYKSTDAGATWVKKLAFGGFALLR